MSMSKKQKREFRTIKAENERPRTEFAGRDSVPNTLPSTNANNVTEDAIISPPVSLARGVNPDTYLSETGPPNDINVTERVGSLTASLSKGVKSDTVLAETVSPTNANVAESNLFNSVIITTSRSRYCPNRD
jgi:hypothetical protein